MKNLDKPISDENLVVSWSDFLVAKDEIEPKFGSKSSELQVYYRNGIFTYNQEFHDLTVTLERIVEQVNIYPQ